MWTPEQEKAAEKLLARLRQQPLAKEREEFGMMLMRHIDSFTPEERKRYDELKAKNKLSVGDEVKFHSGNFNGLTGVITEAKYNVPDTPYGLKFTVKLSNGKIGYIEKAEHWHFV